MQEGERISGPIFEILGEPATPIEPSEGALDYPAARQDDKAAGGVGTLDDLDLELRQNVGDALLEYRPLIAAIGEQLAQERVEAEQRRDQQDAAVSILHIGRMNNGVHQQAFRIDHDVSLLALDLLAGIVPVRVDAGPPFSALFTLWLSTMQAVGLASRSSLSRHWT